MSLRMLQRQPRTAPVERERGEDVGGEASPRAGLTHAHGRPPRFGSIRSRLGPRRPLDRRAGRDGRGYGHLAGALLPPVPAAVRRDADVQPPAGLHRVAHHPGGPAGLGPLRLLSHRLQQPGESGLWQRIPSQDLPRDSSLPPVGSLCIRPHSPCLCHHLLHFLHGWPVLHQQDLLHAVPGNSSSPRPSQGHGEGQKEKLTLRVQ